MASEVGGALEPEQLLPTTLLAATQDGRRVAPPQHEAMGQAHIRQAVGQAAERHAVVAAVVRATPRLP